MVSDGTPPVHGNGHLLGVAGLVALAALLALAVGATAQATGDEVMTDPVDMGGTLKGQDVRRLGITEDSNNLYLWVKVNSDDKPTATELGNIEVGYFLSFQPTGDTDCYGPRGSYNPVAGNYPFSNIYVFNGCQFGGTAGASSPVWICNEFRMTVPKALFGNPNPGQTLTFEGPTTAPGVGSLVTQFSVNMATDEVLDPFDSGGTYVMGTSGPMYQSAPTITDAKLVGDNDIELTWSAGIDTGAQPTAHYRIYRSDDNGASYAYLGATSDTTTSYTDTTIPAHSEPIDPYRYLVSAVNCPDLPARTETPPAGQPAFEGGESLRSSAFSVGADFRPLQPTGLSIHDMTAEYVHLTWTVPADCPSPSCTPSSGTGASGVLDYEVYRSMDAVVDATDQAVCPAPACTSNFVNDTGVDEATTYWYAVRARDNRVTPNVGPFSEAFKVETPVLDDPSTVTKLTLVKNIAASVLQGASVTVDDGLLKVQDPGYGPSEITFQLISLPGLGRLELDGVTLSLVDTFTMLDIEADRVAYVSDGGVGEDTFDFKAATPDTSLADAFVVHVAAEVPVQASIGLPPAPHLTNKPYTFQDASAAGTYPIISREWTLPDGTTTSAERVDMTFTAPGVYTFRLAVHTSEGSSEVQRKIHVVDYQKPQARFFSDLSQVVVGQEVTFWDSTIPGNTRIVRSEWDFKDAVHGTVNLIDEPVIKHAFTKPGKFLVTLRVQDEVGTISVDSHTIAVAAPPSQGGERPGIPEPVTKGPTADAGPDLVAVAGTVVRLEGRAESPLGRPLTISWHHITGTMLELRDADTARPVFAVPHLLEGNAESVLELAVSDGTTVSRDVVRIVLRNEGDAGPGAVLSPTARFTYEVGTGGQVRFRSIDKDLPEPRYEWDFGDGKTSTRPLPDHIYSEPGTYSVRLTLRDAMGREATFSQGVTLTVQEADVPQSTGQSGSGWGMLALVLGGVVLVGVVSLGLWAWMSRGPGHKR